MLTAENKGNNLDYYDRPFYSSDNQITYLGNRLKCYLSLKPIFHVSKCSKIKIRSEFNSKQGFSKFHFRDTEKASNTKVSWSFERIGLALL